MSEQGNYYSIITDEEFNLLINSDGRAASAGVVAVYGKIKQLAIVGGGECLASAARIGGFFGVTRVYVEKAIKKLIACGLIQTETVKEGEKKTGRIIRLGGSAYKELGSAYKEHKEEIYILNNNIYTQNAENAEGKSAKNSNDTAQKTEVENGFNEFWLSYPKKRDKKRAVQAWSKIPISEYPAIMAALSAQKESEEWKKDNGKYIPYPSTWLNGERWNDELEAVPGADDDFIDF